MPLKGNRYVYVCRDAPCIAAIGGARCPLRFPLLEARDFSRVRLHRQLKSGAKYICASAFGGEKMQCTSTRQFERQELCSPKPSEASGVCKLLVRTERRSSSALNAAHDDKQSISLMYESGCSVNCNDID